ncbi:ATP synthase subunit epsilon, mitochondrial [Mizuhopecten yessoensis]|uniref:ATP synthase subunit epsilon, mitochondrial n=1 Tax=Mizuhopecten yessoensis TaxID=6573 RepID=A0A210QEB3_MIZYE|nr:ATP synthase subunit epsilon, mitochondrial [Mizuhopecten yessoensis]
MSSAWRAVGISYIQYSGICAQAVRNALKPEIQQQLSKKGESIMKVTKWEGGKPITHQAIPNTSINGSPHNIETPLYRAGHTMPDDHLYLANQAIS